MKKGLVLVGVVIGMIFSPTLNYSAAFGQIQPLQINPCLTPAAQDMAASLMVQSSTNSTLQNSTAKATHSTKTRFLAQMKTGKKLHLQIAFKLRHKIQFEQCLISINDPTSPNYHHFLNATTLRPYLPTPGMKNSMALFLTRHGFNVTNGTSPLTLDVSASSDIIQKTFSVRLNIYKENRTFYAADTDPVLPSNFAGILDSINGLDNYSVPKPDESPCYGPYCPQGIQVGYSVSSLPSNDNGAGVSVAIVDCMGDPNPQGALNTFDSQYGLAATTLHVYYPDGSVSNYYDPVWGGETMMDIEAVHTVAPGATINLIYMDCYTYGVYSLIQGDNFVIANHIASIVSNSWYFPCNGSSCSDIELYDENPSNFVSYHNQLALDAAEGLTMLFGSGDSGAAPDGTNLGVEFPASDPNVLAVGATDLSLTSCGTNTCSGYGSESGASISGGGVSGVFAEPSWQNTALGSASGRVEPDVSMFGYNPSFWVYSTNSNECGMSSSAVAGWFGCAGTSLSSPLWAGYLAIVIQMKGGALQGNIAPSLYQLYKTPLYSSSFHDVTTGNNGYYLAGTGWDFVTGLGTPVADKLARTLTAQVTISNGAANTAGTCTATDCFNPQVVNINVGNAVTWANADIVGHTATSGKPTDNATGTIWDSNLIPAGGTYTSPTFTNAGKYLYFCQVHPWMTGEITVGSTTSTTITLNPSSGSVGTIVTVTGSGFAASSTIAILYDGIAQTTAPTTVITNSGGSFTATFTVSSSIGGGNTVSASDGINSATATISLATCTIPSSGDWILSSSCTLSATATAPANIIVPSGSVLTIPNGLKLNIDFTHYHLLVKSGGGVLIKAGGEIN